MPHTALLLLLLLSPHSDSLAVASPHRHGPHHLAGWTLSYVQETLESQGPLPSRLILARNGRIVRRIEGDPFLWKWLFVADGKQVAYQAGPLHSSMSCSLIEVASGKLITKVDCSSGDVPADAPDWLKQLEAQPWRSPLPPRG